MHRRSSGDDGSQAAAGVAFVPEDDSGYHAGEMSFRGAGYNSATNYHKLQNNFNKYNHDLGGLDWDEVNEEEDEDDESDVVYFG